jgi:ABC-type transport system substrate-binding protein
MNMPQLKAGIILCYVTISSIVYIWQQWRNYQFAKSSQSWLTTIGQVAESSGKSPRLGAVAPHVVYWYTVAGTRYVGKRVSFGNKWYSFDSPELRRYLFGATVQVYYDPTNPRHSTLERHFYLDIVSTALIGGTLVLCLAAVLFN